MTGSAAVPPYRTIPARPRVAYQGEPGAFGELAVTRHWRGEAAARPTLTFGDALALLQTGEVDYAVIPVWNSTIGDLRDAREILADHEATVDVVDNVALPVDHCLLALPGTAIESVRFVGSHPAALAQCAGFFVTRARLMPCTAYDTAGAARQLARLARGAGIADIGPPPWYDGCGHASHDELAVIAGETAARRYGLIVLAEAIQDDPNNRTRFAVVAPRGAPSW